MESVSCNPIRMIRDYLQRRELRQAQRREQRRIQEEENSRTVEIRYPRTKIRGVLRISARYPPCEYVAFLGIPYALPPVVQLRFQPPKSLYQRARGQPTPLFLANDGYHPCAQMVDDGYIGSEDCLYLNVFTPRKPANISGLLPVLVYIHGGAFSRGHNEEPDPDDVIREDLVVVTINYRLGVFGFLNMRTKNCLGNAGMKDQVMALRWVRANIRQFKGDPKNVTICGQSAGGTCVNLHMISPMSQGYFQKAIVMAGGVYCPWGYGGHAKHIKQLFKDAKGESKELRYTVVESLKEMNTLELLKMGCETMSAYTIKLEPKKMSAHYKPTVECVKKGAFLPDTVEKLMAVANPVPTIAGITKQEGYQYFRVHVEDMIDLMDKKIEFVDLVKDVIRQNFRWKDPEAVERHFQFFKKTYFPEDWMLEKRETVKKEGENATNVEEKKPMTEEEKEWREEQKKHLLATLVTDIFFRRFYDNFKIGKLLKNGWPPFYIYEFDYFPEQPIHAMPYLKDEQHDYRPIIWPQAAEHCDDYNFLFGPDHLALVLYCTAKKDLKRIRSEIDRVQMNMCNLWSSFCSTAFPRSRQEGDASVYWECHTEQAPRYLHIGKTLTLMYGGLNERRWPGLNAICQLEPTIPSLATTPKTPKKEYPELQQSQPKLVLAVTPKTPEKDYLQFQQSQSTFRSSTPQPRDTECDVFELSQPELGPSTSQTLAEEVEECEITYL